MAESEVECFCRVKTAQNFKTAGSDFWKAPFDFIIKWTAKGFFVDKERNNYIYYLGESYSFSFWGNHC